jgi:hypothetical protein
MVETIVPTFGCIPVTAKTDLLSVTRSLFERKDGSVFSFVQYSLNRITFLPKLEFYTAIQI